MSIYQQHIFVCLNERPADNQTGDCLRRGAQAYLDQLKQGTIAAGLKNIRINRAGCLGQCEKGPCAVVYPEGVWYRFDDASDVQRVLDEHLVGGVPVEDLRIDAE